MLIDREVFILPPHISTTWGRVSALCMQSGALVVVLNDGVVVRIPDLPSATIEVAFAAHAAYLEGQKKHGSSGNKAAGGPEVAQVELSFSSAAGLSSVAQHNPEYADMPDLPAEILEKVVVLAKFSGLAAIGAMAQAESGCNCAYCQISRTIHHAIEEGARDQAQPAPAGEEPLTEQAVPAESMWLVEQSTQDEHLYLVRNRRDESEHYRVYLSSEQVGCNCGEHGCVHILAVLRS